MGAWGTGVFENDDAADFVGDVVEGNSLAPIKAAIDRVLQIEGEYLEAPDASQALAAAAILALLKDKASAGVETTEALGEWVGRTKISPPKDLLENARHSIERILTEPSELLELWSESDEFAEWKSSTEKLAAML
jgi:hypothetical protein